MSYTKHTWENGETITAEKLNNLENGIVGGDGFIIEFSFNEGKLDKTASEIRNAFYSGQRCILRNAYGASQDEEMLDISTVKVSSTGYEIIAIGVSPGGGIQPVTFIAESSDDYPALAQS